MEGFYTESQIHITRTSTSQLRFRFGDHVYPSLGTISLQLKTATRIRSIPVVFHEVPEDVPNVLGLYIGDGDNLLTNTVLNRLKNNMIIQGKCSSPTYEIFDCYMPMKFIGTYVFYQLSKPIFYVNFTNQHL